MQVFLLAFVLFGLASCSNIPYPPKFDFITQKIDHFNFGSWDANSYQQRYLYDDRFWDGKGPIFFYCGNEGAIESFWNNTGFMFDIAPSFNALIIFGEHRYYGKSLPFNNAEVTFTQPYIQFLSIEQAMADFAEMILQLKIKFNTNVPVIAFGGSYGGILAAYMRAKYPHIVHGAIAASAPVYWTVGLKDIHGFFEDTTKDFDEADSKCVPAIKKAYEEIMAKSVTVEGLHEISKEMKLCNTLMTTSDLDLMLRWSRNAFVMMSMMDYPYPTEFMAPLPGNPVNVSCEKALKATTPISVLREAISVMYPYSTSKETGQQCLPYTEQYIPCADITGCGLGPDSWAWDFQSCTEIHLYDGSNHTSKDMFPDIPLTFDEVQNYCRSKWGVRRSDKQLATFFGADLWKQTSNIVFSNGRRDPWMNGGILESLSDSVIAVVIEGGAHHLDLRSSNEQDPQSVKDARQVEIMQISKWVKEANEQKSGKPIANRMSALLAKFQHAAMTQDLIKLAKKKSTTN